MFSKRFYLSWIISALLMFLLSYVWHGIFLTDLSRLNYPKELFLTFAAFVYLIIGFVITKVTEFKIFHKHFKRKPIFRGLLAGLGCGFALFLISNVVGVSFSTGSRLENMLLDFVWQLIEQGVGGLSVGIIRFLVFEPSTDFEDEQA